jgi:hypothetical protein
MNHDATQKARRAAALWIAAAAYALWLAALVVLGVMQKASGP